MSKTILAILSLCVAISVKNTDEEKNYIDYHRGFNEVEELIVNESFAAAESKLNLLFETFEVKFVKDIVIAAQLSVLNNDHKKALGHLIFATKRGVKTECLKSIPLFNNKLSQADWNVLEQQYPDSRKAYLSGIDLDLAREFHKRYLEEQNAKGEAYYKDVVYSNFNRIKTLIKAGKFPGEAAIGIDDKKYAGSLSDCELDNSRIIVTFLHYDHPISEIGEQVIIKAIENGELHPREFATIYNFEKNKVSVLYKKSKKGYPELPDYQFNFAFGPTSADQKKVNSDRWEFGICNEEVDQKKAAICKKYGMKLDFGYR